MTGIK